MPERHHRPQEAPVHVLFVAKPRAFRESVAYFTRLLGLKIDVVVSVAAALIVLTRDMVDIVVVDDDLDVAAVLAALHQSGGLEVVVIVITVAVTKAEIARWERTGVFACVPKPFDLRTDRLVLERAVAAVRARRT
jgi:DNA-binding NtrC family response regulator